MTAIRMVATVLLSACVGAVGARAAEAQAGRAKSAGHAAGHAAVKPAVHAAATGASSAQVNAYLNRLRSKLIGAWMLPDGNNHVTLTGNFNQDGLSDNLKASSSPKSSEAEDVAMQAFNKCMPLETMPAGMNNGKLTVDFVSNADPHGDSKSSISLRLDPVKQEAPAKATQAEPAKTEEAPAQTNTPAQ